MQPKPRVTTPIELTLYDPETNEVVQTFTRSFVPWGILKRAMRMYKRMDADDMNEEDLDELAALVVAVFGDQFTVEQVTAGADVGEMLTVVQAVLARASKFVSGKSENPTNPAG